MAFVTRLISRISLVLLALGVSASVAAACPNWNNPTVFGQGRLTAGFLPDPVQVPRITAGGRVSLQTCFPGRGWTGFVISRPDYRLQYQGISPTGRLSFQLVSNRVDTVLLINAPDGSWHYNDDIVFGQNLNSTITFVNPLQGQYDIWTGAYNRSSNNPAQLYITER